MRSLEEIEKEIRTFERKYNGRLKHIVKLRKELVPLEARAAVLRKKLETGELTIEDWAAYDKLKKEIPERREDLRKLREILSKIEVKINELWKDRDEWEEPIFIPPEIPEILEVPEIVAPPVIRKLELIEIDDATGYMIWFNPTNGKYFLVPEGGKVEAEEYFSTLQIYLNYTFETSKRVEMMKDSVTGDVVPVRKNPEKLFAEMRIVITIREANKKVVDVLVDGVRQAFEEYITRTFGQARKQQVVPMFDVEDNMSIKEYPKKQRQLSKLKKALPEVLKVGRYCRLSNEEPNIDIKKETADLKYYAEWAGEPGYSGEWTRMGWKNLTELEVKREMEGLRVQRYEVVKASSPFDGFNLDLYFRMLTKWHDVKSLKSVDRVDAAETTWMKLRRMKEEL
jgi:hypothetical protein